MDPTRYSDKLFIFNQENREKIYPCIDLPVPEVEMSPVREDAPYRPNPSFHYSTTPFVTFVLFLSSTGPSSL
jgi:hypothetical protein